MPFCLAIALSISAVIIHELADVVGLACGEVAIACARPT